MKKIILGLMIFLVTSLFATDVSNFDIKGIKLGMSKDEVLKLMPRGTTFGTSFNIAGNPKYPYRYYADFDWKKSNNKFYLGVEFDHKLQAYEISRNIRLDDNANIEKVAQQIIYHYGKPDFIWKVNKEFWKLCWGKCKKDEYHFHPKENEKILYIQINTYPNHILEIKLFDDKLSNINYKYEKSMYKKAKDELENKASKIDF